MVKNIADIVDELVEEGYDRDKLNAVARHYWRSVWTMLTTCEAHYQVIHGLGSFIIKRRKDIFMKMVRHSINTIRYLRNNPEKQGKFRFNSIDEHIKILKNLLAWRNKVAISRYKLKKRRKKRYDTNQPISL